MKSSNSLFLRKEIYRIEYIHRAIEDYLSICKVEIEEDADYYICQFREAVTDVGLVMREFEDYLIGIVGKYEF